MPFYLSIFFVLTLINILGHKIDYVDHAFILPLGLLFGFIYFFYWFSKLKKESGARKYTIAIVKFTFLTSLLFVVFLNFRLLGGFNFPKNINLFFFLLSIFSGFIIFYANREVIQQNKGGQKNWYSKILPLVILFFIIFNYLSIATHNLGLLPPQNDEFLTYSAAKYILHEGLKLQDIYYGAFKNSSTEFYSRALPYSLGVAVTVKILGGNDQSIFDLRFFSVILGCFTLILIYLLYKDELPKGILLLALYFFSFFYLFIYHSRVARMYSLVLLITVALIYIFFYLFKQYHFSEALSRKKNSIKLIKFFCQRNFLWIISFFLLLFIGLETHYNIGLIAFPILLFSIIYFKNLYFKGALTIFLLFIFGVIISIYLGFYPAVQNYLNHTGQINFNFITFLFENYNGRYATFIFFLLPLIIYRYLPKIIQFSYFIFATIFTFLLLFTNGIQFHDPRYFIFLFPFYTILITYGIYLTILSILGNKKPKIVILITFFLLIVFIGKIQIGYVCKDNVIFSCPISDKSRVFNLDRWNYQYDEAYAIIKNNLTSNTILVSRSLHEFFSDKYGITRENECEILNDYTQNRRCAQDEILKNNILFIVYPSLIYTKVETNGYSDMYNFLYYNSNKVLLYESSDSRILIYKINL